MDVFCNFINKVMERQSQLLNFYIPIYVQTIADL